MKRVIAAGFWLAVARGAIAEDAAPPDPSPAQELPAEAGAKSDAPRTTEPAAKAREGASDVFVPSEDISEDLSVAFPIDI